MGWFVQKFSRNNGAFPHAEAAVERGGLTGQKIAAD
jgi:hypothetical protein